MEFNEIAINQHVLATNALPVVGTGPPDPRVREFGSKVFVHFFGKVLDSPSCRDCERRLVVGRLAGRLRIDTNHIEQPINPVAQIGNRIRSIELHGL